MTNHTVNSLGMYGDKVKYFNKGINQICEIKSIEYGQNLVTIFEDDNLDLPDTLYNPSDLYPILKTADEINQKDWDFIFKNNLKLMTFTLKEETHKILHPKIIERILYVNGIATQNKKSPTGYSDLLGYPCVTEEWIKNHATI